MEGNIHSALCLCMFVLITGRRPGPVLSNNKLLQGALLLWNIMHSWIKSQYGLIYVALDWTQASFTVSSLAGFTCMLSLCAFSAMLCEVSSSAFLQLHLVLGLAGTHSADIKKFKENMQACRKTQTSQTSITDDVCCPLTLPIPESHTASQPRVQPLLWSLC